MQRKMQALFLVVMYAILFLLLYSLLPFFSFTGLDYSVPFAIVYLLIVLLLLSLILIAVNIAIAFKGLQRKSCNMAKSTLGRLMASKLMLIPFFVIHAFWFILLMGGSANPFLFVLWFFIPFVFASYAYIVLLATSSYSIAHIIKMYNTGMLTKVQCALHITMQLLFFADIIDSIYLFIKYGNASKVDRI